MNFDPGIVAIIVAAGVLGWPLDKAIKFFKEKLKATGVLAYIVEALVCAVAVLAYLIPVGFNWPHLGIYTLLVFASVHGFYVGSK